MLVLFGAQYLYGVIALVTVMVWLTLEREARGKMLMTMLISFPLAYLLAKFGSVLYESPRPFVVLNTSPLFAHAPNNGFPSDHTLLSAALGALVFCVEKRWGTLLLILALGVGVSRVLALVHHGVDIVGSMVIASGAVWAVWRWVSPVLWQRMNESSIGKEERA